MVLPTSATKSAIMCPCRCKLFVFSCKLFAHKLPQDARPRIRRYPWCSLLGEFAGGHVSSQPIPLSLLIYVCLGLQVSTVWLVSRRSCISKTIPPIESGWRLRWAKFRFYGSILTWFIGSERCSSCGAHCKVHSLAFFTVSARVCDTVHLALITHATYYYGITNFANPAALLSPTMCVGLFYVLAWFLLESNSTILVRLCCVFYPPFALTRRIGTCCYDR